MEKAAGRLSFSLSELIKKVGDRPISTVLSNRMKGDDFQLKKRADSDKIYGKSFSEGVGSLARLLREVVCAPSLGTLKTRSDGSLSDLV